MSRVLPQQCPLCQRGLDKPDILADFVYGGKPDQKFYHCQSCDVAFLHPPMTEAEEHRFYALEFEKFMETRSGGDFDWSGPEAHYRSNAKQFERRFPFFADLVIEGKSVLEIGCSSGFMLLPLQDRGLGVVGVEPSGSFTEFLKSKGVLVHASLEALLHSNSDLQFDLVLHFFVLEHIRDPLSFLQQAFQLVKPGGYMIFEIPNRSDPLLTIYNIPAFHKFYWSVAHHYYFNERSIKYLLNQVFKSYDIIKEQRYDLSNHMTWAIEGKPGGQGKYSHCFSPELEKAYKDSMIKTGFCDTLICRLRKGKAKISGDKVL